MSRPDLSAGEARRIALAAQGFADRPPRGAVDARLVRRVIGRVGLLQIDSVNVLVRAHYLPLFSRLGPYPASLLDTLAYERRELFEYWGHEASLVPVSLHPLLRWRMARAAQGEVWSGMSAIAREQPAYVESVFETVRERGPISAGELDAPGRKAGPWWGWAEGKRALEWLFWTGRVAIAGRRSFERLYDVPERVIPPDILHVPTPPERDAHRELLKIAGRALGVGTASDLADYFRLKGPPARAALADLVEAGDLSPVTVAGWGQPAYLDPNAAIPRRVGARALVSPFDSLVWERARAERLFGFHYRIEIYTPAPKRRFGYYVLPFLLGDTLVGRVDLKADRKAGALLVHAAFAEAGQQPEDVAAGLGPELTRLAGWLGLERTVVGERGNVAAALREALTHEEAPVPEPMLAPPSEHSAE